MKKYATAYVSFFDNAAIAGVVEAENKRDAMLKALLIQHPDGDAKEWIENMKKLSEEEFQSEISQGEMSVDAIEIQ